MWSAKAHEAKKMCLGVKQTLTNGGECKGWSPMTPKCTAILLTKMGVHLGVTFVRQLQMFKALVGKVNKHQIWPLGRH